MFAFERPADETLVLMAGVPAAWIESEGLAVKRLRTPYGPLSYSLTVDGNKRTLEVAALPRLPNGGVAVAWPVGPERLGKQTIEAGSARWLGNELRISSLPFRVTFVK
jgi:hypothetical protein